MGDNPNTTGPPRPERLQPIQPPAPDPSAVETPRPSWQRKIEGDVVALNARLQVLQASVPPPPPRPSLIVKGAEGGYKLTRGAAALLGLITFITEVLPALRGPWRAFMAAVFE